MYRKNNDLNLQQLAVVYLKFIDVFKYKLIGRYPKISYEIERKILDKIYSQKTSVGDLIKPKYKGKPVYYRTTGGRYYKVITPYSTGSTKETSILFDKKLARTIGAILSSNLYFWFYQIYSNNLDLKFYEVETFKILWKNLLLQELKYWRNFIKNTWKTLKQMQMFGRRNDTQTLIPLENIKIGKSKQMIDKIDSFIYYLLYGFTQEEIDFIINYEIAFRLTDED